MRNNFRKSIAHHITRIPLIGKYGVVASVATITLLVGTSAYAATTVVSHYTAQPVKTASTHSPTATGSSKPKTSNSTNLSNDNHYTNSSGNSVHSPAYSTDGSVPKGATGLCNDGTYTFSQSRQGTCSSHGGVETWLGTTTTPSSTTQATTTTPPAPTCNQSLKDSYAASYNADVSAENGKNASNLQSIADSWNSRGLLYSGGYQSDVNAENARHQAALSSLLTTYNQELASINCT